MSRYHADSVYCYEGSEVLRNKLGVTDQLLLEAFESDITSSRLIELCPRSKKPKFARSNRAGQTKHTPTVALL